MKFGTRYYRPGTGTFTQQDPASQGSNYYAYAGDNPVNATDLTGRAWWDVALSYAGFIGSVVGVATCVGTVVCGVAVGFLAIAAVSFVVSTCELPDVAYCP